MRTLYRFWLPALLLCLVTLSANAQSFRVQCPPNTPMHPDPSTLPPGALVPPGAIKCQQISGGDGFATMGDGHQIFLFGFGPLSGLQDIQNGLPGTQPALTFNNPVDPNGAITDPAKIMNTGVLFANAPAIWIPKHSRPWKRQGSRIHRSRRCIRWPAASVFQSVIFSGRPKWGSTGIFTSAPRKGPFNLIFPGRGSGRFLLRRLSKISSAAS